MGRGLVLGIAAMLVAAGIFVLRDAVGSRTTPVDERRDLAVQVRAHVGREPSGLVDDMAAALMGVCRLEVNRALVAVSRIDADEFRFVLRPTLNESDRRQLHGCLEDSRIQHLQLDVLRVESIDRAALR